VNRTAAVVIDMINLPHLAACVPGATGAPVATPCQVDRPRRSIV